MSATFPPNQHNISSAKRRFLHPHLHIIHPYRHFLHLPRRFLKSQIHFRSPLHHFIQQEHQFLHHQYRKTNHRKNCATLSALSLPECRCLIAYSPQCFGVQPMYFNSSLAPHTSRASGIQDTHISSCYPQQSPQNSDVRPKLLSRSPPPTHWSHIENKWWGVASKLRCRKRVQTLALELGQHVSLVLMSGRHRCRT